MKRTPETVRIFLRTARKLTKKMFPAHRQEWPDITQHAAMLAIASPMAMVNHRAWKWYMIDAYRAVVGRTSAKYYKGLQLISFSSVESHELATDTQPDERGMGTIGRRKATAIADESRRRLVNEEPRLLDAALIKARIEANWDELSELQQDLVLGWLAGDDDQDTAFRHGVSKTTVHRHKRVLLERLGV